jgi:hypothetical protein
MQVLKKWLDYLSSMGLKYVWQIFIRADAESSAIQGFQARSSNSFFGRSWI